MRSATAGCANNAEPIRKLYLRGLNSADRHTLVLSMTTGEIEIRRCACRDWPFSSASKPIDLGLGFSAFSLVGTLNG
jgi:hypothetical protein